MWWLLYSMFDTGDKSVRRLLHYICRLLNEPDRQFNFFKFKNSWVSNIKVTYTMSRTTNKQNSIFDMEKNKQLNNSWR